LEALVTENQGCLESGSGFLEDLQETKDEILRCDSDFGRRLQMSAMPVSKKASFPTYRGGLTSLPILSNLRTPVILDLAPVFVVGLREGEMVKLWNDGTG
jgi:hypothetical protein